MNAWFLFFCALWLAWVHPVTGQELKSIRISLSLGSAQLPLWVARDAGLFAKHGVADGFRCQRHHRKAAGSASRMASVRTCGYNSRFFCAHG